MTAGALNATELRPTALPTYWRSTSSGTQLCRVGASNALAAELSAESTHEADHVEPIGTREQREQQRGQRHRRVRDEQHAPPRQLVGDDAGKRR